MGKIVDVQYTEAGSAYPSRAQNVFGFGRRQPRKYPEQSSRQALRAGRRQQGGPGLEKIEGGEYIQRGSTDHLWKREAEALEAHAFFAGKQIQQGDRLTFRVPRA